MSSPAKLRSASGRRPRHKRWRRLSAAALVSLAVLAVAIAGMVRHRMAVSPPPAISLKDLDPAVAAAIDTARLAVQQQPRAAAAWGRLGMVLLAHDFPAEATACLAQAERFEAREPRWPYYQGIALYQEEPDAAIPKLQRAVELFGDGPDAPRLLLADVLYAQGRLDEAEHQLRLVLGQHPDNTRAQLGLGRLAYRRGNWEESVPYLHQALTDRRTRKSSLTLLAEIHQRLGDPAAAERDLHQLATLPADPPWPDPFVQEVMKLQTGQKAGLDRAHRMLDQGRSADAVSLLQQTVHDYPQCASAWLLLGKALLERQELAAASQALRTAVRLKPDSVEGQFHLGMAAFAQKDRETATACFRKVTQLKPDAQAHYLLGHCLAQGGDRRGALEAFQKALRYRPNYPQAHLDLGTLLAQRGQTIEALAHLQCAVQLDPANPRPRRLLQRVAQQLAIPLGP